MGEEEEGQGAGSRGEAPPLRSPASSQCPMPNAPFNTQHSVAILARVKQINAL